MQMERPLTNEELLAELEFLRYRFQHTRPGLAIGTRILLVGMFIGGGVVAFWGFFFRLLACSL